MVAVFATTFDDIVVANTAIMAPGDLSDVLAVISEPIGALSQQPARL